jgi:hypothetical protein
MSGKLVKLSTFQHEFDTQDTIKNLLRGLFVRDAARKREIEKLIIRNLELEEVVFRMNVKLDRVISSGVEIKNP